MAKKKKNKSQKKQTNQVLKPNFKPVANGATCPLCNKVLKNVSGMHEHMKVKHGKTMLPQSVNNLQSVDNRVPVGKPVSVMNPAQTKTEMKRVYLKRYVDSKKMWMQKNLKTSDRITNLKEKYNTSSVFSLFDERDTELTVSDSAVVVYITSMIDAKKAIDAIYDELAAQSDYMWSQMLKKYVKKKPKVALDLEGKFLSATGAISVLQMCTCSRTAPIYLFDVMTIGPQLFSDFKQFGVDGLNADANSTTITNNVKTDDNSHDGKSSLKIVGTSEEGDKREITGETRRSSAIYDLDRLRLPYQMAEFCVAYCQNPQPAWLVKEMKENLPEKPDGTPNDNPLIYSIFFNCYSAQLF